MSEINEKAYNYNKSSFVLLTSLRLRYLFVKFGDLFLPTTLARTRTPTRDLYPRVATRDI